jgi:D-threo-aldose 1-dehydrogenase
MSYDPGASIAIGRGGLAVSRLGVGTLPFGVPVTAVGDAPAVAATRAALAANLRYFDTAPLYGTGLAEHRLGQALRAVGRANVVISTKVGRLLRPRRHAAQAPPPAPPARPFEVEYDYSRDGALRSIEDSLQRLDTDRIDIALIHDVNRQWQGERLEARYREAMDGAYRALADLRSAGVIRAIGVGVNDWEILLRFAGDGEFDCFMLAGRYTLLDHSALERFLPECERRRIAVLLAAPFNSGILATGAQPGATFFYTQAAPAVLARTRALEAVCARHRVPLAAAALQFPLAHPAVACVVAGMRDARDVAANVEHCGRPIPPALWRELKDAGLIAAAAPVPDTP